MAKSNFNIEEMIKMQFRKARNNGYANNFNFEKECDINKELYSKEKCIVKINTINNSFYHLTNERILLYKNLKVEEVVPYKEIDSVFWMERSPKRLAVSKRTKYDRFLIDKKDGSEAIIENLSDCWQPFSKFISQYQYLSDK